jgi:hypothetical protein
MWKRSLKRQIQLISTDQDDCLQYPVTFYAIVFLSYIKPRVTFKGGSPPSIPNPSLFLASPDLGMRFLLRVVVYHIPKFYLILGEFFLLLFCLCWLKIHKDLKPLSLFKSFIIKTISNFLVFLKKLLWERPSIKILFLSLYSNLCKLSCKGVNKKCVLLKITFQNIAWEWISKWYFIKNGH